MKTIKALKITSVLQGIFCLCCVATVACLWVYRLTGNWDIFALGNLFMFVWIVNPVALISFCICLSTYLEERKQPDAKEKIGAKWVWILVWPLITTAFYLVSGGLFVVLTGGV